MRPDAQSAGAPPARRSPTPRPGSRPRAPHRLAFLGLIAFCIIATSYVLPVADVAMGAAALTLAWGLLIADKPFTLGGTPGICLVVYAGLVFFSVPTSIWLGPSIEGAMETAKFLVLYVVAVNALVTRQRVRRLLLLLVLLIAVFPGIGAVTYYVLGTTKAPGRANWHGVFGNANMVALTMLMHLPFAVAFLIQRRSWWWRLAWGLVALLMIVVAVLTKSRAGFLALAALGLGAIWVSRRRLALATTVLLVGVALAVAAPRDFRDRIATIVADPEERDYSARSRTIIWGVAVDLALSRPLTGIGVGTFERALAENAPPELGTAGGQRWRDTHSTFLNIWTELGTPAFLFFLAALVSLLVQVRRTLRHAPRDDPLAAILRAGTVTMLVFTTMGMFNTFHNAWFFYLHFAILLAANKLVRAAPPGLLANDSHIPRWRPGVTPPANALQVVSR